MAVIQGDQFQDCLSDGENGDWNHSFEEEQKMFEQKEDEEEGVRKPCIGNVLIPY